MTRVLMEKCGRALIPAEDLAGTALDKLEERDVVMVDVKRSRSGPQQRLYWQVLRYVCSVSSWDNKDKLHAALKFDLGKYDLMQMLNGKRVPVLRSTSFEDMDQDEFQEFFDDAMRAICRDILLGVSQDELIAAACGRGTPTARSKAA